MRCGVESNECKFELLSKLPNVISVGNINNFGQSRDFRTCSIYTVSRWIWKNENNFKMSGKLISSHEGISNIYPEEKLTSSNRTIFTVTV